MSSFSQPSIIGGMSLSQTLPARPVVLVLCTVVSTASTRVGRVSARRREEALGLSGSGTGDAATVIDVNDDLWDCDLSAAGESGSVYTARTEGAQGGGADPPSSESAPALPHAGCEPTG